ncbi:MAG: restriction endonuclease subunit S, partial [Bacteroidales bacterium]
RSITKEAVQQNSYKLFTAHSTLMVAIASIGKIGITNTDCYSNQQITAIMPKEKKVFPKFITYGLLAAMDFIKDTALYTTVPIVNSLFIGNIKIPYPIISEQKRIAEFLDKKCSEIDEVISKTEEQISTLENYQKALITETVTKGLHPENGFDDIKNKWHKSKPKKWKICRIKDVLSVLTDYTANGSFQTLADNVEYLDYEDFARVIRLTDLRVKMENAGIYVNESAYNFLSKSSLRGGEILVANVGAYAGLFCEMPNVTYKSTLGPNMFLLKTNNLLKSHLFYYIGLSNVVLEQLIIKATASAQPKLNKQDVKTVYILVPPIEEQDEIINYLDNATKKIETIINQQKESLETLKKYKKSLIYEYVTGKKRV